MFNGYNFFCVDLNGLKHDDNGVCKMVRNETGVKRSQFIIMLKQHLNAYICDKKANS